MQIFYDGGLTAAWPTFAVWLSIAGCCLGCISGCDRPLPKHLNIIDLKLVGFGRRWQPTDLFQDPQVVALAVAIKKGDLKKIDELLDSGVDVNAQGKDDITPLGWALMIKNKAAFRRLLERGADPNQKILKFGTGALTVTDIVARDETDSQWLELVLKHGGDPNVATTDDRDTPIVSVIYYCSIGPGKDKNLELLIKAGADLNHQDVEGWTPLMRAMMHNAYDIAYRFLQAGADYRIKDNQGRDLAYDLITADFELGRDGQMWRERLIDFLEEKGCDFGPAEALAAVKDPAALARWEQHKKERAAKKNNVAPPKP